MAVQSIFKCEKPDFEWLDIVAPSVEELHDIAARYGLHETSVQDCLQPEHLPKFEKIENVNFIVLRSYDETSQERDDTIQELTRKLAIFMGEKFMITIHRVELGFMKKIMDKWRVSRARDRAPLLLLTDILHGAMQSYNPAFQAAEQSFGGLEMAVMKQQTDTHLIERIYFLKQRMGMIKHLLRLLYDVIVEIHATYALNKSFAPFFQNLREEAKRIYFFADELTEDTNNLINVYISLASHRTNEIIRLLTIFSVFFLPLTFIVGIYGMNFDYMPELRNRNGYFMVLGAMALMCIAIYVWIRRKGWLR